MIDGIIGWLERTLGINQDLAGRLLETFSAILIFWLLNLIVQRIVIQRIKDVRVRYQWQKISGYIVFVLDSGVLLTIRYLCEPRQRRTSSAGIWEAILDEFARYPDIDFAYPTQRFYNLAVEGNR